MGEVVVSSEELEVMERESEKEKRDSEEKTRKEASSSTINGLVQWERLLPRMVLRVLLVEADDSTRQIITALLRKCSYRVAAVSDGLMAWELLKGRPHNVDLILTEMDLPSISGYALLSLIMEHEICKNIPVIMMSSQDSVNTVYKCMLRGAADYLVKPIRRNELMNLWQHVWRRQSLFVGGNIAQDQSVRQQDRMEVTSENNLANNHSGGDMALMQTGKEYIEKGSDAQSSCVKVDVEAESAAVEDMQDLLRPSWGKFLSNDIKEQQHGMHANLHLASQGCGNNAGGRVAKNSHAMTVDDEPESQRMDPSIAHEACDDNDILVSSSRREAFDFMGASNNGNSSSNDVNVDSSPHLDLSLRGSQPSGFDTQVKGDRRTLMQSNASAFTRYTNRALQRLYSTLSRVGDEKEHGSDSNRKSSGNHHSEPAGLAESARRQIVFANTGQSQTKELDIACSCPQQTASYPLQIQMDGRGVNNLCTGYGSAFPPIFSKQSGASFVVSPSSASNALQSNFGSNSGALYDWLGHQTANESTSRTLQKQENKIDSLEDRGHISPTTDQSATSSFCNGALNHLISVGFGSASGRNTNPEQVVAEIKNGAAVLIPNSSCHRSIQREAALTKFRLKRKERCYEKKVRYESRKKLAEQRPRVKGQFVRQVHVDLQPEETEQ